MKESRFVGKANEIEMLPPGKIETVDNLSDKRRRKNERFKAVMDGAVVEEPPIRDAQP